MESKLTNIITTVVILLAFMIMVAFVTTDNQVDISKQQVRQLTEEIQYKGYVTIEQYTDTLNKIPFKNVSLQITHIQADDYNTYKPGTLDMKFNTQIMGSATDEGYTIHTNSGDIKSGTLLCSTGNIDNQGIYKFEVGDQVQVDLILMETTFFDAIVGTIVGNGSPYIKMLTSESGVIVNTKY